MNKNYLKLISEWKLFASLLKKQWDESADSLELTDEAEVKRRIWDGVVEGINRSRRRGIRILTRAGVAASIAVLAVALLMWFPKSSGDEERYADAPDEVWTSVGPHNYQLPDGTQVWLESGSRIAVAKNFLDDRRVNLDGNATFDVAKVKGRNFTVVSNGSDVVVKGTCFSIHNGAKLNLTLFSGAVEFIPSKGGKSIELHPSELLTYNATDGKVEVKEIPRSLQWDDGTYRISQINLHDLVDFIESRYDVEITVAGNVNQNNLRMTASVRYDEPVDSIIDRICYVFKLDCAQRGKKYVLSEGCN